MNKSTQTSPYYNNYTTDDKVFLYDTLNDNILFPLPPQNTISRQWLNNIIYNYPEHWNNCLKLSLSGTYDFEAEDIASDLFKPCNIHICRTNDKSYDSLLLITISTPVNNLNESILQKQIQHTLDQLGKERDEFFDLALHDLQSPVRKLSTLLERLTLEEETTIAANTKPFIERIKRVSAELSSLTKGLASLYEAGSGLEMFEQCDLNVIANLAAAEIKALADVNHLEISISNLPCVRGNFDQLKIVFLNLFQNSFKFNNPGTKCIIEVNAEIINDKSLVHIKHLKNIRHLITVKDNGIGLKQEQAVKIFKPFIRLNGKSAFPGIGFGLAVCNKIIAHHQGDIYAEVSSSGGCIVSIVLPEKSNNESTKLNQNFIG